MIKAFTLVLGMMTLFACGLDEEPPDVGSPSSIGDVAEAAGDAVFCEEAGGTCRKSRCRDTEESDQDLECGTDAQCCVPVQEVETLATCSSIGGTCRKSRCGANEHLDRHYQCGTDAACCAPN
ncbi:MAG TPA: hypothetical protein VK698_15965 [Kofleriaceae bacterium]|nr:hypothetical protein [Kofleriaceae bacterium]